MAAHRETWGDFVRNSDGVPIIVRQLNKFLDTTKTLKKANYITYNINDKVKHVNSEISPLVIQFLNLFFQTDSLVILDRKSVV